MNKQKIIQAGKIAKQVKEYAKTIIKKDMSLLEIAEKIEAKIVELGGKPAFPTNLSINDIAAHYTPSHDDKTLAHGLLKIDLGVQIEGWIADTAFSIDLENSKENKKLIKASQDALENATKIVKENVLTNELGKVIEQTIKAQGFSSITNLTGHSINQYELHSGITIPNTKDKKGVKLENGLYAIEPFATSGSGRVYDGKPSGIYIFVQRKPIRNQTARAVLSIIMGEFQTLPFCSRWLVKKLGPGTLFALKQLEQAGAIHQFPQLIEKSHKPISQAENTIFIDDGKVEITT